jgi:hypothetical protein
VKYEKLKKNITSDICIITVLPIVNATRRLVPQQYTSSDILAKKSLIID